MIGLTASIETLLARAGNGAKRPLLKGANRRERVEELVEATRSQYAQAHLTVDTSDLTLEQVVDKIVDSSYRQKMSRMQTLTVNLGDRSYPIHVGVENLLERAGELLQQAGLRGKVASSAIRRWRSFISTRFTKR